MHLQRKNKGRSYRVCGLQIFHCSLLETRSSSFSMWFLGSSRKRTWEGSWPTQSYHSRLRSKSFISTAAITSVITSPWALINYHVLLQVRPSLFLNFPFSSTLSMSTSIFSVSKQVVSFFTGWIVSRWTVFRWTIPRWTVSGWTVSGWTVSRWTVKGGIVSINAGWTVSIDGGWTVSIDGRWTVSIDGEWTVSIDGRWIASRWIVSWWTVPGWKVTRWTVPGWKVTRWTLPGWTVFLTVDWLCRSLLFVGSRSIDGVWCRSSSGSRCRSIPPS